MSDLFTPTIARTSNLNTNAYSNSKQTSKTSDSDTDNNVGYLKDPSADNLMLTMQDFLQMLEQQ